MWTAVCTIWISNNAHCMRSCVERVWVGVGKCTLSKSSFFLLMMHKIELWNLCTFLHRFNYFQSFLELPKNQSQSKIWKKFTGRFIFGAIFWLIKLIWKEQKKILFWTQKWWAAIPNPLKFEMRISNGQAMHVFIGHATHTPHIAFDFLVLRVFFSQLLLSFEPIKCVVVNKLFCVLVISCRTVLFVHISFISSLLFFHMAAWRVCL